MRIEITNEVRVTARPAPWFSPWLIATNITLVLVVDVLMGLVRALEEGGWWPWTALVASLVVDWICGVWVWRKARAS